MMLAVQLVHVSFVIYLKAYENFSLNLINVSNEIFCSVLAAILLVVNSEAAWNSTLENVYTYIILGNSGVGMAIVLSKSAML